MGWWYGTVICDGGLGRCYGMQVWDPSFIPKCRSAGEAAQGTHLFGRDRDASRRIVNVGAIPVRPHPFVQTNVIILLRMQL